MINLLTSLLFVYSPLASALGSLTYVPESFRPETAKVVVVIHGCLQSSEGMAAGSGWNLLADSENLLVIYPQVPSGTNPLDCWSWYERKNQRADSGQLADIKKSIDFHIRTLGLKGPDVFVTGISSGAGMAAGMLACFPTFFKSGAIHSGPPYGLVTNLQEGDQLLKLGRVPPQTSQPPCSAGDFKGRVMVMHGRNDTVVHTDNADLVINQFAPSFDSSRNQMGQEGYRYEVSDRTVGGNVIARKVMVDTLKHAWSGYNSNIRKSILVGPKVSHGIRLPFFDAEGPNSTRMIWNFFDQ